MMAAEFMQLIHGAAALKRMEVTYQADNIEPVLGCMLRTDRYKQNGMLQWGLLQLHEQLSNKACSA